MCDWGLVSFSGAMPDSNIILIPTLSTSPTSPVDPWTSPFYFAVPKNVSLLSRYLPTLTYTLLTSPPYVPTYTSTLAPKNIEGTHSIQLHPASHQTIHDHHHNIITTPLMSREGKVRG